MKIKWLVEYSYLESFYYDSGDVEDHVQIGHCTFNLDSDDFVKANQYANENILPQIVELENNCKYSKCTLSRFSIDTVSHLIEF